MNIGEFISQNARELEQSTISTWLSTPGRLGSVSLGDPMEQKDGAHWIGAEEFAQHIDGEWKGNAHHYCQIDVKNGVLVGFEYVYSVLWDSDSPAQQLATALVQEMGRRLGKATRHTKTSATFEWEGGELRVANTIDEYSGAHVLWFTARGVPPHVEVLPNEITSSLSRPDPKALKEALRGGCESYECGLSVEAIHVHGDAAPYRVEFEIRYSRPGFDHAIEESFSLVYEDPAFDVVAAALDEIDSRVP